MTQQQTETLVQKLSEDAEDIINNPAKIDDILGMPPMPDFVKSKTDYSDLDNKIKQLDETYLGKPGEKKVIKEKGLVQKLTQKTKQYLTGKQKIVETPATPGVKQKSQLAYEQLTNQIEGIKEKYDSYLKANELGKVELEKRKTQRTRNVGVILDLHSKKKKAQAIIDEYAIQLDNGQIAEEDLEKTYVAKQEIEFRYDTILARLDEINAIQNDYNQDIEVLNAKVTEDQIILGEYRTKISRLEQRLGMVDLSNKTTEAMTAGMRGFQQVTEADEKVGKIIREQEDMRDQYMNVVIDIMNRGVGDEILPVEYVNRAKERVNTTRNTMSKLRQARENKQKGYQTIAEA